MRSVFIILGVWFAVFAATCGNLKPSAPSAAEPAPNATTQAAVPRVGGRIGGIVQGVDRGEVVLQGGERFAIGSDALIIRSAPVDPRSLRPGDFVAVTAKRQPNGTLLASVVNLFPESMRGLSVGQRPMDGGNLMTNATISDVSEDLMTNATVDEVSGAGFKLSFPGGDDQVTLDRDTLINQFETANVRDLIRGTSITASVNDGAAQFITIK